MKPFGMARLAEEFGFVVTPCLDGSLRMPRNRTTPGAFEIRFFWLAFGHELGNKVQHNNARNYSADDEFR